MQKTGVVFARDAQLHRLSAGPPGPRHGPGRRTRRDQRRPRVLHPGLAAHPPGERRARSRPSWRTDPKRSGAAGCFGDIGTHAYNLGRFITGLIPDQISCHLKTFEPGPARSTITARPSSATATAPSAPSPPRRSRTAAKTTSGSRSTAPKARWNGIRKSRTRCWLRVNGQPHQIYTRDRAARTSARRPARSCRIAERPSRGVSGGVRQHLHRGLRRHDRPRRRARSSTAPTASIPTSPTASTA